MFQIVYASSALCSFNEAELLALMEISAANNARVDVTGILLYKGGNFMQVLEGEESAVMTVYDRITRDPRHRGVLPFMKGNIPRRDFPRWSMAYRNLDGPASRQLAGYSDFLNAPLTGAEFAGDPSRCQRLLLIFKENLR